MRRLRLFAIAIVGAALLCGAGGQDAIARPQQAPGSRVVLDLPGGYQPAKLFSGFMEESAGVSLVILEMPRAAYEELARGLTEQALATKGITDVAAGKLERPDPYLFMRGQQVGPQGVVAKFLLAFHNKTTTALVTANVLKSSLDSGVVKASDIERILAGASLASEAAPGKDVFSLGYLGPFQSAGKILGTTRAYTLDGKFEPPKPGTERPLLVVSPSIDNRPVPDGEARAEELFKGLPGVVDIKVVQQRRVMAGGVPVIEIEGTAVKKGGTRKVSLYQALILPANGGYYRMVGEIPEADASRLMPEFPKIVQSFRIVE